MTRAFCSVAYLAIGLVVLYSIYEFLPLYPAETGRSTIAYESLAAPVLAAIGTFCLAGLDSLSHRWRPFAVAPALGAVYCGAYLLPALTVGFIALSEGQGGVPQVSVAEVWFAIASGAAGFIVLFTYFVVTLLVWNRRDVWRIRVAAALGPAVILIVLLGLAG